MGDNGETLAVSEGYFSKWNAKRAARKNFGAGEEHGPALKIVEKPYKLHT